MAIKITLKEYNRKIDEILDDPTLQVHEKLIKALEEGYKYRIIKVSIKVKGGGNDKKRKKKLG